MLQSTIRDVQALLTGPRVLTLAVLVDGAPHAGLLPFATLADRSAVLVHASQLARHSAGLVTGARVSALIREEDAADKDPLQLRRVTFECLVHPLARNGGSWHSARDLYLARFPDASITFDLADFTLYRLEFLSGTYVAGFGRAIALAARDIRRLAEHP
jgi:heme oxygenase (biliverdin-IX-beta and delta-forming)